VQEVSVMKMMMELWEFAAVLQHPATAWIVGMIKY
jgi:hypothetical protein